ncbi:hypothetical protein LSH36_73g04009 [Paralvinella palmiformis]|uniref:Uncharacterized protein n=1 Tax=Paralvinella palmiformis TaxID=53620 RepID=A0AAD9K2U6_9ANNE|nr:hypothetical protein LSH36_73g04009 [Paralvinella palmiformis]
MDVRRLAYTPLPAISPQFVVECLIATAITMETFMKVWHALRTGRSWLASVRDQAMMSEDSDYTSDFNYPINSHQGNQPTHQFGGEQPYGVQNNVDTYENADYAQTDYYDNYDGTSYERVYGDQRYERGRERDYYMYQMETNYHQPRSDTDSEPLYYNSRPNSRPQSLITDSPHGSGATPDYFSPRSTLDYTPTTLEDYETWYSGSTWCLYGSDVTPEYYSPSSPPDHAYTPTAPDGYQLDFSQYAEADAPYYEYNNARYHEYDDFESGPQLGYPDYEDENGMVPYAVGEKYSSRTSRPPYGTDYNPQNTVDFRSSRTSDYRHQGSNDFRSGAVVSYKWQDAYEYDGSAPPKEESTVRRPGRRRKLPPTPLELAQKAQTSNSSAQNFSQEYRSECYKTVTPHDSPHSTESSHHQRKPSTTSRLYYREDSIESPANYYDADPTMSPNYNSSRVTVDDDYYFNRRGSRSSNHASEYSQSKQTEYEQQAYEDRQDSFEQDSSYREPNRYPQDHLYDDEVPYTQSFDQEQSYDQDYTESVDFEKQDSFEQPYNNKPDRYDKLYEDEEVSYDKNVSYDKDSTYDKSMPYDKGSAYDESIPYDKRLAYDKSSPYDNNPPYDKTLTYDKGSAYGKGLPYDEGLEYDKSLPYDKESAYDKSLSYDKDSVAYDKSLPYDNGSAYDKSLPYEKGSAYDKSLPYDKGLAYDQMTPYDKSASYDNVAPYDKSLPYDQSYAIPEREENLERRSPSPTEKDYIPDDQKPRTVIPDDKLPRYAQGVPRVDHFVADMDRSMPPYVMENAEREANEERQGQYDSRNSLLEEMSKTSLQDEEEQQDADFDNISMEYNSRPPPRHSDTQGSVDTITSLTPQVKETLPAYDIQTNPNVPSPARVRWLDACNKVIRKLTEVSRRTMLRLIKSVGTLYDLLTVAHTQNLFL